MADIIQPLARIQHILQIPKTQWPLDELLSDLQTTLNDLNRCGNPLMLNQIWRDVLEQLTDSIVLQNIATSTQLNEWVKIIHQLILACDYTLQAMFYDRASRYGNKILFRWLDADQECSLTWSQTSLLTQKYAQLIHRYLRPGQRVAIYATNSPKSALLSIACLTTGIENILINDDISLDYLAHILKNGHVGIIFVSSLELLDHILKLQEHLPDIATIFIMEHREQPQNSKIHSLPIALESLECTPTSSAPIAPELQAINQAQILFTPKGNGLPKGVVFRHIHLVFKRYCRALALPDIGPQDTFLCYLPLCHGIGQWFELWGSIFWGATYCFAEQSFSDATLVKNFQYFQPTIFVGMPKKWIELYERIIQTTNFGSMTDQQQRTLVQEITGGRLKYGLATAGPLDPKIFRFFQHYGIELLCGYGAIETTGGITMTPPGQYQDGSIGRPLPGIEIKCDQNDELCLRGDYIADCYFPDHRHIPTDVEGWFHTGDIVHIDSNQFIYLKDRKKDIYKNLSGQTIVPSKIEEMFEAFSEVKRCFLVGEGKEYNTLLIYPNYDMVDPNLRQMTQEALRHYFYHLIVSVNRFLTPDERIYDFTILTRDFSEQYEEITDRNTVRRKVVEQHFSQVIEDLYRKDTLKIAIGKMEVHIPYVFLYRLGILETDISYDTSQVCLSISSLSRHLTIQSNVNPQDDAVIQIGNGYYRCDNTIIPLERILQDEQLWLGNWDLVHFLGFEATQWKHRCVLQKTETGIQLKYLLPCQHHTSKLIQDISLFTHYTESSLSTQQLVVSHTAISALFSAQTEIALQGLQIVQNLLKQQDIPVASLLHQRLLMTNQLEVSIALAAFKTLLSLGNINLQAQTLYTFLSSPVFIWDHNVAEVLFALPPYKETWQGMIKVLYEYRNKKDITALELDHLRTVIRLTPTYVEKYPHAYKGMREELARWILAEHPLAPDAQQAILSMTEKFRSWLGPHASYAVHPDTGKSYTWDDVLIFDDGLDPAEQEKIRLAFSNTVLLKESLFLLANQVIVELSDILPGNIWITLQENKYDRRIYHVTIQTRQGKYYQFVLYTCYPNHLAKHITGLWWLIWDGMTPWDTRILPECGGVWIEYQLISVEHITYHSLEKWLANLESDEEAINNQRLANIWPGLVLRSIELYVEFWRRTGQRWLPTDPSPQNICLPIEDEKAGGKIRQVTGRKPFTNIWEMIVTLRQRFFDRIFFHHPIVTKATNIHWLFHPFLEVLGEQKGIELLQQALQEAQMQNQHPELRDQLERYIDIILKDGFLPRQLYLALQRYQHWLHLHPMASTTAMHQTLEELYHTYHLRNLEKTYPALRLHYFLNTVLTSLPIEIKAILEQCIQYLRYRNLTQESLREKLSALANSPKIGERESFFITRIYYPHLQENEKAIWIPIAGQEGYKTALMITKIGKDGEVYHVRAPQKPKEEASLRQLFVQAKLEIDFLDHHCMLILLNHREEILGGIVYSKISDEIVYLKKIVIAQTHRNRGLGAMLLRMFFEWMQYEKVQYITASFK